MFKLENFINNINENALFHEFFFIPTRFFKLGMSKKAIKSKIIFEMLKNGNFVNQNVAIDNTIPKNRILYFTYEYVTYIESK